MAMERPRVLIEHIIKLKSTKNNNNTLICQNSVGYIYMPRKCVECDKSAWIDLFEFRSRGIIYPQSAAACQLWLPSIYMIRQFDSPHSCSFVLLNVNAYMHIDIYCNLIEHHAAVRKFPRSRNFQL